MYLCGENIDFVNHKTKNMFLQLFKSKIHCATVTEANLNYVGSITIDETLMKASGILEGERVQVVNNNNGARLETYVIKGEADSGVICLNGAAARLVEVGDVIIIIAYAFVNSEEAKNLEPTIVFPNKKNRLEEVPELTEI
jgi:aspartate 1-decarboxylase